MALYGKEPGFCGGLSGGASVYRNDFRMRIHHRKDGKRLYNKELTQEQAWHCVEVLRKYGLIPVMEGADFMYYDKEEYNTSVNWYADLITEALGERWRPIKGFEKRHAHQQNQRKNAGRLRCRQVYAKSCRCILM